MNHPLFHDPALDAAVKLAPPIPDAWGGAFWFRAMLVEHNRKPQEFFQHMPALSPECAAACVAYFAVCSGRYEVRVRT